jgi:hypothetical protein
MKGESELLAGRCQRSLWRMVRDLSGVGEGGAGTESSLSRPVATGSSRDFRNMYPVWHMGRALLPSQIDSHIDQPERIASLVELRKAPMAGDIKKEHLQRHGTIAWEPGGLLCRLFNI